jgi:hypothetical protein
MSVLPVTSELILAETCAGLRPGTPDNGPIVGYRSRRPAAGHRALPQRHLDVGGDRGRGRRLPYRPGARQEWEPFGPGRFLTGEGAR